MKGEIINVICSNSRTDTDCHIPLACRRTLMRYFCLQNTACTDRSPSVLRDPGKHGSMSTFRRKFSKNTAVAYTIRNINLVRRTGTMVCLLAAPWVQLSVSTGNGWPHNALRHHWLMPISCHFRDGKALLVTSLTRVSGARLYIHLYSP